MAITGPGIDTSAAGGVKSTEIKKFDTGLGKDAFLQLLATEMQNQDPLEPTSNTEYISQLAQFSALEAMQDLNTTSQITQAISLTGSYVIMNTTDAAGNVKQISGLVDFVTVTDGKAYMSIDGKSYPFEDFDSVVDPNYILNQMNKGDGNQNTDKTENNENNENNGGDDNKE